MRESSLSKTFGVIGSGRQGTAAAYDLAANQAAERVVMFDADAGVAHAAAERVNRLAAREVATAQQLDVRDYPALVAALGPLDVVVCAVPFAFIPTCTKAAIEARTGMVDLGGHTETVLAQLALNDAARAAGIAIVPDCGMGPGLNNTFGMYLVERLEAVGAAARSVRLYDGGLPQDRSYAWGFRLTFHIDGLTNEYDGQALYLRDGKVTPVDTLTELETIDFAGLGPLEAFVTSGGTSTVPYSLEGRLEVYECKTLRYPGHLAAMRAFKDLGLFSQSPIEADGCRVSPRALFHALLGPQIEATSVEDLCIMRSVGTGRRDGREIELAVELVDRYDPLTGFSAMERVTGWHAAIMAGFIADGAVSPGVHSLELAMPATPFIEQVRRRGFQIEEAWTGLQLG